MADLVSPIVDIISRLWTCCGRHTRYLCKLQQNKILLSTALDELKEARDVVQTRVIEAEADPNEPKKRTNPVSGWLQRVETINGEVEVILQKADEQLSRARSCLGGCCPPNNCWSNYKVGKSVAMKKASVDELKGKGRFEELTYRLPQPSVLDMNLESTVGMESMFDKVWRLVTSTDDKPVRIMGLYGQGGVGKTTLLKRINKEFHKISGEHGFDYVVIFVLVSKPVNYEEIQKKIGERLGLSNSLQGDVDENSRAEKIFNELRNKNYVLLLDDIWEDQSGDQFDKKRIGIPIDPQGNSKLIFTTRSEMVCGEMKADKKLKVECLPRNEAWRLFKENVGEEALNYFPTARELAKVVAEECDGLPLALIALGKAMSTKKSVKEWSGAIRTLRRYASEFKYMRDKVLPSLKLSYDNLPDETEKSCFCYCSLYPEDYSIEIAQLVDLWIAEGFLDGIDNLDEARERGHTIIGSLKSACLLESSDEPRREKTHVKMHDVIRDLALWIVNDCSSRSTSDKFLVAVDTCEKLENAQRIFWYVGRISNHPPTFDNLLTLLVRRKEGIDCLYSGLQTFFQHMPRLRVLDLSYIYGINVGEFPMSICELHELQYLNLSKMSIRELPVELRKLVKLKFLVLMNTYARRKHPVALGIPAGLIANFSELQVLNLGCAQNDLGAKEWELEDGPSFSELDGLKQLQEVRITISTNVALEKFLCNRKLQMICTGLQSCNSDSSSSSLGRVLDLSNFKNLKDLALNGRITDDGWEDLDKLEELVLYGGLETLDLNCLPKFKTIIWMAPQPLYGLYGLLSSLHLVSFFRCDALKDLTWLVYVENLETLDVVTCRGLKTIIESSGDEMLNTGGGGGGGVFRRLKTLYMHYLPKLKSICRHALAFPSIETIHISRCPKLKKLPLDSGSNVNNTLKRIEGEEKWWNELQWEEETMKSKFLPYYRKEAKADLPSLVKTDIDMAIEVKEYMGLTAPWKETYIRNMMKFVRAIPQVKALTLSGFVPQTYLPLDLKPPFGDGVGDDSEGEFSSEWSLHHLKCVEFKWVLGCVNELKFLQVVLKHSLVLEKLLIAAYEFVTGKHKLLKKFRKKLLTSPIASPHTTLVLV